MLNLFKGIIRIRFRGDNFYKYTLETKFCRGLIIVCLFFFSNCAFAQDSLLTDIMKRDIVIVYLSEYFQYNDYNYKLSSIDNEIQCQLSKTKFSLLRANGAGLSSFIYIKGIDSLRLNRTFICAIKIDGRNIIYKLSGFKYLNINAWFTEINSLSCTKKRKKFDSKYFIEELDIKELNNYINCTIENRKWDYPRIQENCR